MKPRVIVLTVIGTLIVIVGLIAGVFWFVSQFSNNRLASGQQSPGFGPGMMGSGKASGGLIAVSADGAALPVDPSNQLPENTAAQKVGSMNVSLALSPYPPVGFKDTNFDITLTDEQGQAITDAIIQLDLTMPGMWMPANSFEAKHTGNGLYHATGMFTMRDLWRIEVIIQRGGETQSAFFDVVI